MLLAVFLEVVVIHLDAEDDGAHHGGEAVSDEQWPVLGEQAIDGKQDASQAHQQESAGGNVVGATCLDGVDSLWQIA